MATKVLYVDESALEEKISNSPYKIEYIVENLGISRQAFAKKRKGITAFKASEVYVLCDLLDISGDEKQKIFLP